jgi:hypothetical protein
MPGDDIDPTEIKGNLSIIPSHAPLLYGDGSIDVASNINIGGYIGENDIGTGTSLRNLKSLNIKEVDPLSDVPDVSGEHKFYIDQSDSLLKSKNPDNSITTIYQPCNTKGDISTHDGTIARRLSIGLEGQILSVNNSSDTGLLWSYISNTEDVTNNNIFATKYYSAYSSQSLEIPDNTYVPVIFGTTRIIDNIYRYNENFPEYVEILTSGVYYITFRASVDILQPNDTRVAGIRISKDSGAGFIEVPGTKSYTYHKNGNRSLGSATVFYISNFSAGDKIKCEIRLEAGNIRSLQALQNACSIDILRISIDSTDDNTKFFSAYNSSNISISSTLTDINLNTTRISTSPGYTYSSGILTFEQPGTYLISFCASSSHNVNGDRYTRIAIYERRASIGGSFVLVSNSILLIYNDDSPLSLNSGASVIMYIASTGDSIRLRGTFSSGSANVLSESCNLNVIRAGSSTNNQTTVKSAYLYNSSGLTDLNSSFTDIPLNTEVVLNSGYTHVSNSPEVTILEGGVYFINAVVALGRYLSNNDSEIKMRISVNNNGSGYLEEPGMDAYTSMKNLTADDTISVISGIIQVTDNSKIKIQAAVVDGSTSVRTILSSSGLSINRYGDLPTISPGIIKFGSYLKYAFSRGITIFNSNGYLSKIHMFTGDIPEGTYRIAWTYLWSLSQGNEVFYSQLLLDGSTNLTEDLISGVNINNRGSRVSSFIHVDLSSGVHLLELKFRVDEGDPFLIIFDTSYTVSISDARLEFWRLK